MPVKVRCACGAGISAPDAARGKVIKCRKCGEPVRVPRGDAKDSGAGKPPRRKKAAGPRPSIDDDDFFSRLDLEQGEDQDVRICPKCAAEVDEEDIECPQCGVNLETGVLSKKQKKKRKRRGPDLDEFPNVIWKGSCEFLKKNKSLAFRLIGAFSLFSTIFCVSLFMAADYCIPEDPTNEDTPIKLPVILFWSFVTGLSGGASMGCFWQLFTLVVAATMEEKDSLDRFNLDFFVGVALGFKVLLWPLAIMGIVLVPAGSIVGLLVGLDVVTLGDSELNILGISVGVLCLIPLWTFPVAMSHMSSKYTYRAYIPYDVFRFGFAAFKGVCLWWVVAFCVMLPAVAVIVPSLIFFDRVYLELGNALLKLVELTGTSIAENDRGFMFMITAAGVGMGLIIVIMAVIALLLSFSAVFLMRATGIFTFYYQKELGLGEKRKEDEPAGFWIRYLALMIDIVLVGIFMTITWGMIFGMQATVVYLEFEDMVPTLNTVGTAMSAIIPILYFIFTESSPGRGTLGMNALGLIITDMEGKSPIERSAAATRLFTRVTLIVGAFTMQNDPKLQTMHDKISKTRVIWQKLNH